MSTKKKILYIDMDGVLVNFQTGINKLSEEEKIKYKDQEKNAPHIFSKMEPIDGAIEAFIILAEKFDTYILSTAPWIISKQAIPKNAAIPKAPTASNLLCP